MNAQYHSILFERCIAKNTLNCKLFSLHDSTFDKSVCKLVCESYTVEIKMSETKSFKEFVDNTIGGKRAYMYFFLDPKRTEVRKGDLPCIVRR
jgi:hypothetical protein